MATDPLKKKPSPELFRQVAKAYERTILYGQFARLSEIDKIISKRGRNRVSYYWEMVDTDSVLSGVIETRIDNVSGLDRIIIPASPESDDLIRAEFVKAALLEVNRFEENISELLGACVTGYSVMEVVWKEWEYEGQPKWIPDYLISVDPDLFYLENGEWFIKKDATTNEGEPISKHPYKFIIHAFRERYSNHKGVSLLKPIYWPWWFKHNAFGYWLRAAEVGAEITPVMYYDENTSPEEIEEMEEACQKFLKAKYLVVPDKCKVEFPHIKIDSEFASVLVEKVNQEMRYRVLGSILSSGVASTGGLALGVVHAQKEQERKEHDAKSLDATLNETLIQWLVELNYPELSGYPKIKSKWETTRDIKEVRANISLAVDFGIPMTKTYVASELQVEMADEGTPEEDLIQVIEEIPVIEDEENKEDGEDKEDEIIDDVENDELKALSGTAKIKPEYLKTIEKRKNDTARKMKSLEKGSIDAGMKYYNQVGDQIVEWLNKYNGIEEALAEFATLVVDIEPLRNYLSRSFFWSILHGMFNIYDEPLVREEFGLPKLKLTWKDKIANQFGIGLKHFPVKLESFWEPVPFDEAIEMFEFREVLTIDQFRLLEGYARRRALTATGMSYNTIRNKLYTALETALIDGIALEEFSGMVDGIVLSPAHAEVIFRTNVQSAYNAGHAEAIFDLRLAGAIPAFQFSAVIDNRTTAICEERDGMIYSRDVMTDWDIIPPCHYSCRSTIIAIFSDEYSGRPASRPFVQSQEGFGTWKPILEAA